MPLVRFNNIDIQMRTNVPHIFAIGDISGVTNPAPVAFKHPKPVSYFTSTRLNFLSASRREAKRVT